MEQAECQEKLLESSAKELEKRKKKEDQLKQQLHRKEAEKLNIEEKYATLQEEAAGKTKILKEVWKQFQQTKEEVCGCMYNGVLASILRARAHSCVSESKCTDTIIHRSSFVLFQSIGGYACNERGIMQILLIQLHALSSKNNCDANEYVPPIL